MVNEFNCIVMPLYNAGKILSDAFYTIDVNATVVSSFAGTTVITVLISLATNIVIAALSALQV